MNLYMYIYIYVFLCIHTCHNGVSWQAPNFSKQRET